MHAACTYFILFPVRIVAITSGCIMNGHGVHAGKVVSMEATDRDGNVPMHCMKTHEQNACAIKVNV